MPRFFAPLPLQSGTVVALPETVAHHVRVLRLQEGAPVTLFNGDGGEYAAELLAIDKKSASAMIGERTSASRELPYALTLAQALPEAAKMDWIVEKAVELGVAGIVPLAAQRCVVRLSGERAHKRHLHWQGVIVAATEQSGRNRVARLAPVAALPDFLASRGNAVCLLLSPRATTSLADWARQAGAQDTTLLVGPEGGFTAQEEEQATAAGAIAVSMGARVLRTETAALAAVAALSALWGGM